AGSSAAWLGALAVKKVVVLAALILVGTFLGIAQTWKADAALPTHEVGQVIESAESSTVADNLAFVERVERQSARTATAETSEAVDERRAASLPRIDGVVRARDGSPIPAARLRLSLEELGGRIHTLETHAD